MYWSIYQAIEKAASSMPQFNNEHQWRFNDVCLSFIVYHSARWILLTTGPHWPFSSMSGSTTIRTVATGLTTAKPRTLEKGQFYQQIAGICSAQFWLQLSITVLIISSHNQYVDCVVCASLSPPAVKFATVPIFCESILKTHNFRTKHGVFSEQFNQY